MKFHRVSSSRYSGKVVLAGAVLGTVLSLSQVSVAAPHVSGATGMMQDENASVNVVMSKLNKKQFSNVKATLQDGVAILSGTVDLYEYKADADKRVHKVKGVTAVRNDIQVAGPAVPDGELKDKLVEKLEYDRVGYGDTAFNAISVGVQSGMVTLGGHARSDVDKDSALAVVSMYPGVKDVTDEIEVDPVSFMDDRIRVQVARSVYSYPSLSRYYSDPGKPIRISVQNGKVELYGVVDSKADSDVAYLRANSVPGVFSVTNHLQVANQQDEKSSKK